MHNDSRLPTLGRWSALVAASAALVLAACGGGDDTWTDTSAQATSSIPRAASKASSTGAAATAACEASRAFGFTAISGESARASANGVGTPYERNQASELWTLEITPEQVEYIVESLAGGCTPLIEFTTEGTTSALNAGRSSYRAKVEVLFNGQPLRRPIREGESFPMAGCDTIVCQQFTDYARELPQTVAVGDLLTVSSSAIATAIAGGTSSSDQAHADWQLDSPLIRVPIP